MLLKVREREEWKQNKTVIFHKREANALYDISFNGYGKYNALATFRF